MPTTERGTGTQVYIRDADLDRVRKAAQRERRKVVDQLTVIIDEWESQKKQLRNRHLPAGQG
jgi:hypothetical protein